MLAEAVPKKLSCQKNDLDLPSFPSPTLDIWRAVGNDWEWMEAPRKPCGHSSGSHRLSYEMVVH